MLQDHLPGRSNGTTVSRTTRPGRPLNDTTRSARKTASAMECVTSRHVQRLSASTRCSSRFIASRVIASSDANGSSRRSSPGDSTSARARATRWRMPIESSRGRWRAKPSMPVRSQSSAATRRRSWRRTPRSLRGRATLSRTLSHGRRFVSWKTSASCSSAPGSGRPPSHRSRPPSRTRPVVGGVRPATARSSVVFPQPDGPTMATTSPSCTVRSTGSSACTAPARDPNRFDTSRSATSVTGARPPGAPHAKACSHRSCV